MIFENPVITVHKRSAYLLGKLERYLVRESDLDLMFHPCSLRGHAARTLHSYRKHVGDLGTSVQRLNNNFR